MILLNAEHVHTRSSKAGAPIQRRAHACSLLSRVDRTDRAATMVLWARVFCWEYLYGFIVVYHKNVYPDDCFVFDHGNIFCSKYV